MKKKEIWIKTIAAGLFLLTISYLIKVYYFERSYEPLDQKYFHFQQFNTDFKSEDFIVHLLCKSDYKSGSSPTPIYAYASISKEIIAVCYSLDKDENDVANFYKIDENGNTIDSISLNAEDKFPYIAGEFIFYSDNNETKSYNTWPKNGDSTERQIIFHNQDFTLKTAEINDLIEEAKASSQFYFFDDDSENGKSIKQFYYYKNEQWQVILEKMKDYYSSNYEYEKLNNQILKTGETNFYLPKGLELIYFHKKMKLRYGHIGGGGNGGYYLKNWRGNGYFRIKIGGKNFDYFIPHLVIEKEAYDQFESRFYLVPEKNYPAVHLSTEIYISPTGYALFTNEDDKLYVIKKKK